MQPIQLVLVIDDEPDIRSVLEMTMSSLAGWRVLTASSGMEGIQRAKNHLPDLILLDVMMPDMDGPETLQALGLIGETSNIPVIFMTAKARFSGERTIVKPFDPAKLINRITELLDMHDIGLIDPAVATDVGQKLLSLWDRHRTDTLCKVDVLHEAARLWQTGALDQQLRQIAISHAHTLAGTAGLFGFTEAAATCNLLEEVFEGTAEVGEGTDLVDLVAHIRDEFEKSAAGRSAA